MVSGLVFMGNPFDHLVKFGFDLSLEVGLDLVHLGEFGKRPAPILLKVIYAWHPVNLVLSDVLMLNV